MNRIAAVIFTLIFAAAPIALAGGWDTTKGLDKITLKGELVCVGCSLKKMNGANAQCSLFAHHAMGFKAGDGTLWSIVDNEKGHDIIRAHTLLGNRSATISGWIYPLAHFVEIDTIEVQGVSMEEIQKAAWEEDRLLAKRLGSRKMGEAPETAHTH